MKGRTVLFGTMLVGGLLLAVAQVQSQDNTTQKPKQQQGMPEMTPEMAAHMAEWMKLATPSEHHKKLQQFVGNWNVETKVFMGGPGSEPIVTQGSATLKWVLGGRFVMEEMQGTFMGQPFEGIAFTGYDNYRNMYVGSWIDNMGTQMLTMTGTPDQSGKVFTFYGEMDEPALKVHGRMVKYVHRVINENKNVFEMYDLHAGDDYKVMEVVYTRK